MSLITPEILLKMRPSLPPEKAEIVATKLEAALIKFGIITDEGPASKNRVAHVLSQIAVESNFLPQEENLNYSAEGLRKTWPNRFTQALAEQVARKPELIANIAYARPEYGNTEPGDGFRYRGRGLIQTTFKGGYKAYGDLTGFDLVNHPQLLLEIGVSCLVAAAYFAHHRWKGLSLIQLADSTATGWSEQVENVTRFVNGGQNGIDERKYAYKQACLLLGVELRVVLPPTITVHDIPALPLPNKEGQFYYPVPMGDGPEEYNNSVGKFCDPEYFEELKSQHSGADLNINRLKGESVDKELGRRYGPIFDGIVVSSGTHKVWGHTTVIEHIDPENDKKFWTQYAHSQVVMVKVGDRVYGGKAIGTIGKGGDERLPAHLHWEWRIYGPDDGLPEDFWASQKYPTGPKDPKGLKALACIRRNYRDGMAELKRRGAINPTF